MEEEKLGEEIGRLIARKALLEAELETLNWQLDRAQNEVVSSATNQERARELVDLVSNTPVSLELLTPNEQSRWNEDFQRRSELGILPVKVFFDHPRPLFLTVFCGQGSPVVVNIIESIKDDIRNLGNPIILAAIERYKKWFDMPKRKFPIGDGDQTNDKTVSRIYERRRRNLEAVVHAILETKDFRDKISPFATIWEIWGTVKYDESTFECLVEVLRSSRYKSLWTDSNRVNMIRRTLAAQFPDLQHDILLDWFKDRLTTRTLPQRISAKRLKNDYVAWRNGVSSSSGAVYSSHAKRVSETVGKATPSADQVENAVGDAFEFHRGIDEFSADTSVAGLVLDIPKS